MASESEARIQAQVRILPNEPSGGRAARRGASCGPVPRRVRLERVSDASWQFASPNPSTHSPRSRMHWHAVLLLASQGLLSNLKEMASIY